ncbi:uncharacterized protein LOC119303547 [Triticum dicoccoides]|uniref:uncharacterized protein LOC119303547 n=1 Tax=Triticum dicoccoides TaxID=85692 RepID=UPI0018909612|nr:uncharacterized protein LOC119303547 [Triticum dicoccoides]
MLAHAINLCQTQTPHQLVPDTEHPPLPHNSHRALYGSIQSRCSTNFTGTPTTSAPPQIDPLMDLSFHSPTSNTQLPGDEDHSAAHVLIKRASPLNDSLVSVHAIRLSEAKLILCTPAMDKDVEPGLFSWGQPILEEAERFEGSRTQRVIISTVQMNCYIQ